MAEQLKNYIIYGYSGRKKRNNKEYISIKDWRETKNEREIIEGWDNIYSSN